MIDVTQLQSSSLFAGFANVEDPVLATINIPGGQTIPGFAGGALSFFADVKRPSNQSLSLVLFQVIGPTTVDGLAYDSSQQRSSGDDYATWYQPDSGNFEIRCDILRTSSDNVRLRVSLVTLQVDPQTYAPAITVNAKVYFFKYPWE